MRVITNICKTLLLIVTICQIQKTEAQQEPQYTQFMYNKLPINSAYTGAREALSIRMLYRNQWVGIDGAPQTVAFSIHSPIKKQNSAFGGFIVNDRLGVTNQTWFDASYAYRIKLGAKTKLSIGINAGMLLYKSKLTELSPVNPNEPAVTGDVSKVLPDLGTGLYLYHPYYYVGLSVPNMIKSELFNKDQIGQLTGEFIAQRTPHIFMMAGGVIPINDAFKIRPQYLGKYIISGEQKIPFSNDFNLSFLIVDRINIGASYRTTFGNKNNDVKLENADSFDFNLEVWPTKQLLIGYAYDYTLSKLGDYNNGSHEVILGYDFNFQNKKKDTPRYF